MQVSEIYPSMQGEGPRVGVPTIFVRFAGCNLKCPLWPCDTQHAIDPSKYRKEWKQWSAEQVVAEIARIMNNTGISNVCFTGGEPFLQNENDFHKVVAGLILEKPQGVEFEAFTNGTLEWPTWALFRFNFIMDWKLEGSGEIVDFEVMMRNASKLRRKDAIKFTIADPEDLIEARSIWEKLQGTSVREAQFFVGAVYGKMDPADIAAWTLQHMLPWRLNVQVHKYIFDPSARRT